VPGLIPPLKNAEEIKFHTGAAEEHGWLYLLEDKVLAGGTSALATVVLDQPVAAAAGDRFIIRRANPPSSSGGGVILMPCHEKHRPMRKQALEQLRRLEQALGGLDLADPAAAPRRMEYLLQHDNPMGLCLEELSLALLFPLELVTQIAADLAATERVVLLDNEHCIHTDSYAHLVKAVEEKLRSMARDSLSADLAELRGGESWPKAVWSRVLKDLQLEQVMIAREGKAVLSHALDQLPAADRKLVERILELYLTTGFQSPRPEEVPDQLKADKVVVSRLMKYLCDSGQLVRLSSNVVLHYNVFRQAEETVVEVIKKERVLDSAEFKLKIGSSRKYALAILDFLDSRRVTLRMDNLRKLAPGYERNLL
jgi:selenocysteine-specific elongation factor